MFSNLWAPVPVIETLPNVRGGGRVVNLPAMLLEVGRISGKQLLLLCWKLPWRKGILMSCLGRSGLAVNMGETESLKRGTLALDLRPVNQLPGLFLSSPMSLYFMVLACPHPFFKVLFLPSSHVNIIFQLVSALREGGQLLFLPASVCFLLKSTVSPGFFL